MDHAAEDSLGLHAVWRKPPDFKTRRSNPPGVWPGDRKYAWLRAVDNQRPDLQCQGSAAKVEPREALPPHFRQPGRGYPPGPFAQRQLRTDEGVWKANQWRDKRRCCGEGVSEDRGRSHAVS